MAKAAEIKSLDKRRRLFAIDSGCADQLLKTDFVVAIAQVVDDATSSHGNATSSHGNATVTAVEE